MVTRTLIAALDHAESPRAVKAAIGALEWWTGGKTVDVGDRKMVTFDGSPYYNADPDDWAARNGFYRLSAARGGGSGSYSGKTVTPETALEFNAFSTCVKIISEDTASCPLFLHERDRSGDSIQKAYGNSLSRVIHDQVNPEMSAGDFIEAMTSRACLGLDGFARIERGKSSGQVAMLWPLIDIGTTVTMERNSKNQQFFVVKEGNSPEQLFRREQIFHLKGYTMNGSHGDDVARRLRHAIGLGLAADEYAGRFFANDASPGIIISRPVGGPALPADQVTKAKDAWKKWHQGASRSHEPAFLEAGAVASRLDPDHQKLQLHEARKYQIIEMARHFRVPLHMLAELDRATFSNIEHQTLSYVKQTLRPWFRRWEDAVQRCLLTDEEKYWPNGRPRMFAEFNVESLVRGDFVTQWAGFSAGLLGGVYCINDVLRFLNMPTIGPDGDVHRTQMQNQDVSQPPIQSTAAIAGGGNNVN